MESNKDLRRARLLRRPPASQASKRYPILVMAYTVNV